MKKVIKKTGVVAEKNGKYWGVQREGNHYTESDFGDISNATISNPKFCKKPTDMTWDGSHNTKRLRQARLRKIVRTIIYEVES